MYQNFTQPSLVPEMITATVTSDAPCSGYGPTDTNWPDGDNHHHLLDPKLDPKDPDTGAPGIGEREGDGAREGYREIYSLPLFLLNDASLFDYRKKKPLFGKEFMGTSFRGLKDMLLLASASVDKDKDKPSNNNNNNNNYRPAAAAAPVCLVVACPMEESIGNESDCLWTVPLPEESLVRMCASGEWMKLRLQPPKHASEQLHNKLKNQLWVRSSVLLVGGLLDRFTQLWSVHSDWAAHHILTTAALEEFICDSIIEGTYLTRRSAGGGKEILDTSLFSMQKSGDDNYRGVLPSGPSNSESLAHVGRSNRSAGLAGKEKKEKFGHTLEGPLPAWKNKELAAGKYKSKFRGV